jgi:hypothetical protein
MPISIGSGVYRSGAQYGVLRERTIAFPAGMVARWTLDDTAAGYVDLVGGATLTPSGTGIGTTTGIIGNAASFSGNGVLSTPDRDAFNVRVGFAIEAWTFIPVNVTLGRYVTKEATGIGTEWQFYTTNVAQILFEFQVQGGDLRAVESANFPGDVGSWRHIVAVVGASNMSLYRNGVAVVSSTWTGTPIVTTAPLSIGNRPALDRPLTGNVDEVAIWQFGASGDPGAAFWLNRYNGGIGRRP